MLTVYFNEPITIGPKWNKSDFDIFIEGPNAPYIVNWTLQGHRRDLQTGSGTTNYLNFNLEIFTDATGHQLEWINL